MTREEVTEQVLAIKNPNLLLEIPTGFGKSRLALDILKKKCWKLDFPYKILIVIPRNVLQDNWHDEFTKWEMEPYYNKATFTTYVSLPKHAGRWDLVIFDECHHITERCMEALESFTISNSLLLSATVKRTARGDLRRTFRDLYIYQVSTRDAIDDKVLPDPEVKLLPLKLNSRDLTEVIEIKKTGKRYSCTPQKYYDDISRLVDWYKQKSMGGNRALKNIWLHKAGERLKWLSKQKSSIVLEILSQLSNYRTLTFCSSIQQTEELGKNHIHCKNKESKEILEKFNEGKIKHITSVNMLDEGMNLKNCQIGIYANLNSSERIVKQRLGRILRHKKPVIIIPFFLNTRDEEIVKQMLVDYNPTLISTIYKIEDIKI